jgi:NMD protein affecting ribosome stability and mRNA decay
MSEYFEATLQLRNITPEILDFVKSELKARKMIIAKTVKQRKGVDLFLPSQKFAAAIGKTLVGKFGGEMVISTRLFGQKLGKTIYRAAILYTGSDYVPGDVIEIDRKVILLRSIGKFASGYDLVKGGNTNIVIKGKTIKKLDKFTTQVTKNYPHLEVLHPETYQSVPVLNPKPTKKAKVDVVIAEKGVYVVE